MRVVHFRDTWIDLDHILAITDVEFANRMGYGGWFVEFRVVLAFRDSALIYSRELDDQTREKKYEGTRLFLRLTDKDGQERWIDGHQTYGIQAPDILACVNFQKEADVLVEAWRGDEG
jgi:hypothetical protein